MQTNILWKGIAYNSLENCLIKEEPTGVEITSTIVGSYEDKVYEVNYHIKADALWHTLFFEVYARHSNSTQHLMFESDGRGNWLQNGQVALEYTGCRDLDIPLTPLTNTLPIRRMQLSPGRSENIKVIYCDLLAREISPVSQQYTCITKTEYHYENVPNDFEAKIEVDEIGLVINYPSLFVRSAAQQSRYL